MRKKKSEKPEKSTEKPAEKGAEKGAKKRRKYLEGNLREMTAAWKKAVIQRIDERGWTHAKLADALGCNRSLVAKMLADDQNSSRLVDRVCLILQIPEPLTAAKAKDSLDEFISHLSEDERQKALDVLQKAFDATLG